MNKIKKSINSIIEILLIFSIILAVLSIFFKVVVLNKNTYINMFNENNAYEQVKELIYTKIDTLLISQNINYDIKESIITENDIKRETDNFISAFVEYSKTGENNIKQIDTELYKQRVADVLHSIISGIVKTNTGNLTFNGNLQMQNIMFNGNQFKFDNMLLNKDVLTDMQVNIEIENLMSKSEAEDRAKEILKKKGLTEEQAIEKAIKKGITEEQALKILSDYGIIIDGYSSQDSNNISGLSKQLNDKTIENSSKEIPSSNQTEETKNHISNDKSGKSKLDIIAKKLIDKVGNIIEKEVEKINLDKILESSEVQNLAQIISMFYKMFWVFMILPIIIIVILVKLKDNNLNSILKVIRNSFLLAGIILFVIFFGAYFFKVYENININIVYFKDIISYTIKDFLVTLSIYGIITFVIGLFLHIPIIKKYK